MKTILRIILLVGLFSASYSAFAETDVSCQLVSSNTNIPASSKVGQSYVNTYNCHSNLPFTVVMDGSINAVSGQTAEGAALSGSCQNAKVPNGQSCQFSVNFTPKEVGQHGFNLNVSIGAGENTVFGPVESNVTKSVTPTVSWPSISGQAKVDAGGNCSANGDCYFDANATINNGTSSDYVTYYLSLPDQPSGSVLPAVLKNVNGQQNFALTSSTIGDNVQVEACLDGATTSCVTHTLPITFTPVLTWATPYGYGQAKINNGACTQDSQGNATCYFYAGAFYQDAKGDYDRDGITYSYVVGDTDAVDSGAITPEQDPNKVAKPYQVYFKFNHAVKVGEYLHITANYDGQSISHKLKVEPVSTPGDKNPIVWPGRNEGLVSVTAKNYFIGGAYVLDNKGDKDYQDIKYTYALYDAHNNIIKAATVTPKKGENPDSKDALVDLQFSGTAPQANAGQRVVITATYASGGASYLLHGFIPVTDVRPNSPQNPYQTFLIYNNTNEPIYPVYEAGNAFTPDLLINAAFKGASGAPASSNPHKAYVELYPKGGIPAYSAFRFLLPLWSKTAEGYYDWWNGSRVHVYDVAPDFPTSTKIDITDPDQQVLCEGNSLSNDDPKSADAVCDANALTPFYFPTPAKGSAYVIPENAPDQLTEYSLGAVGSDGSLNAHIVDYDISYVDSTYLPVALAPYSDDATNNQGFSGTNSTLAPFQQAIAQFINKYSWPNFYKVGSTSDTIYKLPSSYILFMDSAILKNPATAQKSLYQIWDDLTGQSYTSGSEISDLTNSSCDVSKASKNGIPQATADNMCKVWNMFLAAAHVYRDGGGDGMHPSCVAAGMKPQTVSDAFILHHIFGWAEFTDCSSPGLPASQAELATLPTVAKLYKSGDYQNVVDAYKAVQDSSIAATTVVPNPYVKLIHGANYLNMNAYAYSIDDGVGNMELPGEGMVMTVGGGNGQPIDQPYQPPLKGGLSVQAGQPQLPLAWKSICFTSAANGKAFCPPIYNSATNFGPDVSGAGTVTLTTNTGDAYSFHVTNVVPPLSSSEQATIRSSCKTPYGDGPNAVGGFCNNINVNANNTNVSVPPAFNPGWTIYPGAPSTTFAGYQIGSNPEVKFNPQQGVRIAFIANSQINSADCPAKSHWQTCAKVTLYAESGNTYSFVLPKAPNADAQAGIQASCEASKAGWCQGLVVSNQGAGLNTQPVN